METETRERNRKIVMWGIVVAWIVFAVVAIIVAIIINITRGDGYEATVKCAPYASAVFVDDERVGNNTQVRLEKGEHEVMCFMTGFEIHTEKKDFQEGDDILIGLAPVTQEGREEVERSTKDYYDLESFAGRAEEQSIERVFSEEEKKIAKILPIINAGYGIGVLKGEDDFWVTITVKEAGYTDIAVNRLLTEAQTAGIMITKYNVRVNDFVNVLERYQGDGIASTDLVEYLNKVYAGTDMEIKGNGMVGDYGYALISVAQPSGERVVYRAVLKNDGTTWKLVNAPYPILTVSNTLDVPQDVLETINTKSQVMEGNT